MMTVPVEQKKGRPRSWAGPWLFLFAVAVVHGAVYAIDADAVIKAVALLQPLLLRIVPALALVFVFLVLINAFVDRQWVGHRLGTAAGIKGWVLTVTAGILSAGPIYAWYPLLGELKSKGMSNALIAAFLYARALKLPLLPIMAHYFGFAYTLTVSICIIVSSVLTGLLTSLLADFSFESQKSKKEFPNHENRHRRNRDE